MGDNKTMGTRIASVRISKNLSQYQLAALAGVGTKTVFMYENDMRRPSLPVLIKLARVLHVSTDYILMGEAGRYIDVSGLDERETRVLSELVEILRENAK